VGKDGETKPGSVRTALKRLKILATSQSCVLTQLQGYTSSLIYGNQGRWKDAEELGLQVLERRKRVLGAEHPDTLTGMATLAFTWKAQSRRAEALALMEECVLLRTQILGLNHPVVLSSSTTFAEWKEEGLNWFFCIGRYIEQKLPWLKLMLWE
jgi:hypothetical protein